MARGLANRLIERARRVIRGPARTPGERSVRDPFSEYRDIAGPRLVGGPTPRRAVRPADGRLVVLMPHLTVARMSGGPNTILQVTGRMAREGVPLRYVAAFGPLDPDENRLRAHIRTITGIESTPESMEFVDASAAGATFDIREDDVLFATWWPTAHVANAALGLVRADAFVYLIQDYEPGFYPWSTKYCFAAATYAMPIRAIVNQAMLLDHLRTLPHGGLAPNTPTISFTPAVDRGVFAPRTTRTGSTRRLTFYARPKNPRNLFDLGLRALRTAAERGVFDLGRWEFAAIGQDLPDLPLSDRHILRAMPWLEYERYGQFLGETDVLLSLMLSPHTSYPPLEMATTGGRVVTNTFGSKTAAKLRAISPSIHGVEPDVEALVEALDEAVRSIDDSVAGPDDEAIWSALPVSWDEALHEVVPWLAATVSDLRSGR